LSKLWGAVQRLTFEDGPIHLNIKIFKEKATERYFSTWEQWIFGDYYGGVTHGWVVRDYQEAIIQIQAPESELYTAYLKVMECGETKEIKLLGEFKTFRAAARKLILALLDEK